MDHGEAQSTHLVLVPSAVSEGLPTPTVSAPESSAETEHQASVPDLGRSLFLALLSGCPIRAPSQRRLNKSRAMSHSDAQHEVCWQRERNSLSPQSCLGEGLRPRGAAKAPLMAMMGMGGKLSELVSQLWLECGALSCRLSAHHHAATS